MDHFSLSSNWEVSALRGTSRQSGSRRQEAGVQAKCWSALHRTAVPIAACGVAKMNDEHWWSEKREREITLLSFEDEKSEALLGSANKALRQLLSQVQPIMCVCRCIWSEWSVVTDKTIIVLTPEPCSINPYVWFNAARESFFLFFFFYRTFTYWRLWESWEFAEPFLLCFLYILEFHARLQSEQHLCTIDCPNPAVYNPAGLKRQGENQDEGVATIPEDESVRSCCWLAELLCEK